VLKRLLRIDSEETSFARRNFRTPREAVRIRLERVGETFLEGYHAALADAGLEALSAHLELIEAEFRGFGYEGAAMALDLLDQLKPWKGRRIQMFLEGQGQAHIYMVHVGIGWSLARFPWGMNRRLSRLDPLLRWLALDGFGFHEGYFHWARYAGGGTSPKRLAGYALRAFDQGLGRSLWFVAGADPEWIARAIMAFPESRHGDLWSGVGLACAYAGGADGPQISRLRGASGSYVRNLAQGAVFAAKTRERARNPAPHTELACPVLCDLPAVQAAAIADDALLHAKEGREPAYESWRRLIQARFRGSRQSEAPCADTSGIMRCA
jgi:enediyne biosynthesis protein E3